MLRPVVLKFSGKCEVDISLNGASPLSLEERWNFIQTLVIMVFLSTNVGSFPLSWITDVNPMLLNVVYTWVLDICLRVTDFGVETRHLHILGS